MSGAVVLVIVALVAAAVGSFLLWAAPKMFRRRPPSFKEQLEAVAPRAGTQVGPAGGISTPRPLPERPSGQQGSPTASRPRAGPAPEAPPAAREER